MKLLAIITLTLMLFGCSTFDLMKEVIGLSSSEGISVDAQIGDRENELQLAGARGTGKIVAKGKAKVTVNTSTHSTASRIEKAEKVTVNNYSPEMLYLLMGVIILFVPSPLKPIMRSLRWLRTIPQRMSRKASVQKPK